jgi:Txe/YoeB family toxin of toxin-antitoxin system
MVKYKIYYNKKSVKNIQKLKAVNLEKNVLKLIEVLKVNPFQTPPPYEKLSGDFAGIYSRRINIKHRLVYSVDKKNHIVYIHNLWTHYE